MKRIISILLLAALCLSMAACSSVDKEFEAADALLQAGDYQGAIAAFSSIGRYQEIKAKVNEAEKLLREANYGFLFGIWRDLLRRQPGDDSFMIREDGSLIKSGANVSFSFENSVLSVGDPLNFQLVYEEIDGVKHLRGNIDGAEVDYVTAEDYEVLGPYTVSLNMDNWSEYFELREAVQVGENQFGEIQYASNGYGVFLKDEYLDKLHYSSLQPSSIDFKISYDLACFKASASSAEEALKTIYDRSELEMTEPPSWAGDFVGSGKTASATVSDWRNNSSCSQRSDYYNCVAGVFADTTQGLMHSGSTVYLSLPVNGQVTDVQGKLVLLR